ncbi:hypothetical protein LINPERHAP2_LOCUS32871 [Linum perenne]
MGVGQLLIRTALGFAVQVLHLLGD